MRQFLLVFFVILFSQFLSSQSYTISGYIEDAESGEKLISANIFSSSSSEGTISNNFGYFSLTLTEGDHNLRFSYIGYTSQSIELQLYKDTTLNIKLAPDIQLESVVITAENEESIAEKSQMSLVEIPIKQIKKVPALLGEVDVLRALQLLPGVQSGGEGQSGLYVRGGSPDQNLILLDGVPVYNASHLFGFFSVFNADAIKDVKLIKGGFPARYGGRLSSVLEINLKEGNSKSIHGAGSIGLISSKLTLEGPIVLDKTSFIVSGRRTYVDLLAKPFIKRSFEEDGQTGGTGYYFYDVNAKVNHRFSDSDRIYLSFYGGNDRFYFNEKDNFGNERDFTENDLEWGNITSALRWNHVWNPKLFSNTTLTYSKYDLSTSAAFGTEITNTNDLEEISLGYTSGIEDVALKFDFDFIPMPAHFVRFGVSSIWHLFRPGIFDLKDINTSSGYRFEEEIGQDNISSTELALYIEDDWKVSDKFKANIGLHISGFAVNGKFYNSFQPRLSARYLIKPDLSLKASFSTMRQYIHLLAFEGIGLPTDLWLPTTDRVAPQNAYQAGLGLAKQLGESYELSIEGYYKKMENLISYKEGSGLFEFSDWQDRITQGDGDSYGVELFVQKKTGRFTGWLGYTLSWTFRQFDDLNFGNEFPFRYDRRHDISIVGQYQLSDRINISGSWVYGTGNAVTLSSSKILGYDRQLDQFSLFLTDYYKERNNFRMGSYHRLDFGINFVKQKKNYKRTWSIGAYNTYARKNPFFVYEDIDTFQNGNSVYTLKQASLFPLIPYVTFSFEF